jgi:hypothetical protein
MNVWYEGGNVSANERAKLVEMFNDDLVSLHFEIHIISCVFCRLLLSEYNLLVKF